MPPHAFPYGYRYLAAELWREFKCEKMLAMYQRYFDKKPEEISIGRNRCTFIFRTYVVKLPRSYSGLSDNDWESSISNIDELDTDEIQYARTRLAQVGDIPVLFMERVEYADWDTLRYMYGNSPAWVNCVDCGQVGFNRAGRLVAFDYGYN